jgi:predicted DNA-binding transcriptional regulator YafY
LPPVLLDPDEAVAVAVCLRLAAGGSVAGVGDSALRALSKLDQVMPARLRAQVAAVHNATVTLTPETSEAVEPDTLMTLARACRDHEHVTAEYTDRAGHPSRRRLEPYQLVTTGRRWYLLAHDRDREDWRSLRLDRMGAVLAAGSTFIPRPAPDAREYVQHSISAAPYRYVARVRYQLPASDVARHFSPQSVRVEPEGADACVVTAGGDQPEMMVLHFAIVHADFEVLEPPEVRAAAHAVAERLHHAGGSP